MTPTGAKSPPNLIFLGLLCSDGGWVSPERAAAGPRAASVTGCSGSIPAP
ncbi:MAG: hypothetical protein OJF62_000310 [Pseudolabrys sp.]|nr:hypothetical protein [Pseudolabrys sp.]